MFSPKSCPLTLLKVAIGSILLCGYGSFTVSSASPVGSTQASRQAVEQTTRSDGKMATTRSAQKQEQKPMWTEPKIEKRDKRPTVGIRTRASMQEFGKVIPEFTAEVLAWLKKRGIQPTGAPFLRFHVIDMASAYEIEVGVPVAKPHSGEGRIRAGVLPAGRYVTLVYTGVRNGFPANAALQEWAKKKGIEFQRKETAKGEEWSGRIEFFLTDPGVEPDMDKWQTEVAFLIKDTPKSKWKSNVSR